MTRLLPLRAFFALTLLVLAVDPPPAKAQLKEAVVEIGKIVGKEVLGFLIKEGLEAGKDYLLGSPSPQGQGTPPDVRVSEMKDRLATYEAALRQVDAKLADQIATVRKELSTKTSVDDVRKVVGDTLKSLEDRTNKLENRQDLHDSRVRELEELFGSLPSVTPAPLLTTVSAEAGTPTAHPLMAEWITLLMKSEASRIRLAELRATRPETAKAVQDALAGDKKITEAARELHNKVLKELAESLPKRQALIAEYKPGTPQVRKFDESLSSVTWLAAVTRPRRTDDGDERLTVPNSLFAQDAPEVLRAFELAKVDRQLIVELHGRYAAYLAGRLPRVFTLGKDADFPAKLKDAHVKLTASIDSALALQAKAADVAGRLQSALKTYANDSEEVRAIRQELTKCLQDAKTLHADIDAISRQALGLYLDELRSKRPAHPDLVKVREFVLMPAATWLKVLAPAEDLEQTWKHLLSYQGLVLDCTGEKGADAATVRAAQVAWAKFLGEKSHEKTMALDKAGKVLIEMVLVPPGKYYRGSPAGKGSDDERPQKVITLTKAMWVGKYEVTQAQYMAVTGKANPSGFKKEGADAAKYPVEQVNHDDAVAFCTAATGGKFQLLTEAQWEYACRAGTRTEWYNGDDEKKVGEIAQFDGNNNKATAEVGSKAANAFGLNDMAGNVWEWCADWYDEKFYGKPEAAKDPECRDSEQKYRVLRGGSWFDIARLCRAAGRDWREPTSRSRRYGLRLAAVPSGQ